MSNEKLMPRDPMEEWIRLREKEAKMTRDLKFLFRPTLTFRAIARTKLTSKGYKESERQWIKKDALRDLDYLQQRAEQEVAQAQLATNPAAVAVHFQLAERYLERVRRLGLSKTVASASHSSSRGSQVEDANGNSNNLTGGGTGKQ